MNFKLLFSIFPSFTFFASSITSPKSCYLSKASHASSSLSPPPEPYQILLPVNNLSCIALAPSSTYEITAASTGKYVLYFSSSESSGDRQHLLRLPHRLHVGFEDMSGAGAPAVVDASVTSKLMPTSGASDRSSLAVKTSNLVG
ncbi:hypothetical protein Q9189_003610 [Teloschistes chrysophthalmus]